MGSEKKIFFITGEISGGNIVKPVIEKLRKEYPDAQIKGVGHNFIFCDAGVDIVMDAKVFSVMGIFEVVKNLFSVLSAIKELEKIILNFSPDIVILVDSPGLNLKMAKFLREQKGRKPLVYYLVSPQIWAWNYGRINKIRKIIDHVGCIFPFEQEIYEKEHIAATYIGHPFIRDFKMPEISSKEGSIGIFPGSRAQEVEKMLQDFFSLARFFLQKEDNLHFIISAVSHIQHYSIPDDLKEKVEIIYDNPRKVMALSSFLFVKSGTVALESLFSGKPFFIFYKTSFVTLLFGKFVLSKRIKSSGVGMPNIIAGKNVIPEFIQNWNCNEIYEKYREFKNNPKVFENLRNNIYELLGKNDYVEKSFVIVNSLLKSSL